jgi:hypothetical protein
MTGSEPAGAIAPAPPAPGPSAKKDRSPSFPFITLTKAVDRARELYTVAKRHDMRLADAADAMGYGAKSSGAIQTLAALIAFGLVEDNGTGDARKFRITDLAFKALEDQRPGARDNALAEAAMSPKMIAEYASQWKAGRPTDGICISELRIDGGFTEDGAKAFLRVFDDAMGYAKVGSADKKVDNATSSNGLVEPPEKPVGVGDLVCVENGGQIVFERTRVRAIREHDGQMYVFTEATESGAKMSDVTLLEKAAHSERAPIMPFEERRDDKPKAGEGKDRFTVDEGVVEITFPEGMTSASVDDLEAFFTLFIKKAKRRAGSA